MHRFHFRYIHPVQHTLILSHICISQQRQPEAPSSPMNKDKFSMNSYLTFAMFCAHERTGSFDPVLNIFYSFSAGAAS